MCVCTVKGIGVMCPLLVYTHCYVRTSVGVTHCVHTQLGLGIGVTPHLCTHTVLGYWCDHCSLCSSIQARPKLSVVDPLDYEGELNSRRKDLEKEQYLNLLLFPQEDITVS